MTPLSAAAFLAFLATAAALAALWIAAWHALDRRRADSPRPTWSGYALWLLARALTRFLYRATFEGLEHIPTGNRPGPLIVVANHTAGIDPGMLQAVCPFEIRWMMMREMNVHIMRPFTAFLRIILVDQDGADLASTRTALRHLRDGGVIGLFPEGHIERPPRILRPFQEGVGFLVRHARAAVLPVWISGTPESASALASVVMPCRARIVFTPIMHFDRSDPPEEITRRIQDRIAQTSGWPVQERSDESPPH